MLIQELAQNNSISNIIETFLESQRIYYFLIPNYMDDVLFHKATSLYYHCNHHYHYPHHYHSLHWQWEFECWKCLFIVSFLSYSSSLSLNSCYTQCSKKGNVKGINNLFCILYRNLIIVISKFCVIFSMSISDKRKNIILSKVFIIQSNMNFINICISPDQQDQKCSFKLYTYIIYNFYFQIAFHDLNPFPMRSITSKREHHYKLLEVNNYLLLAMCWVTPQPCLDS